MNVLRQRLAPAAVSAMARRSVSRRFASTFGVVFDVDGVLLRGKAPIPGAREVIEELQRDDVPFAIMTNGGGYLEEKKATQISQILGVDVSPSLVCVSHTPMRALADKHRDDLVLAVGKDCDEISAVMANYGFRNVVTVGQLHNHFPTMYPDIKVSGDFPHEGRFEEQKFGAIFVLIDPIYWGRELQIVMDVLCANDGLLGSLAQQQHVPLYSACSDFQYVGEFHLPRFGAGAFRAVLEVHEWRLSKLEWS